MKNLIIGIILIALIVPEIAIGYSFVDEITAIAVNVLLWCSSAAVVIFQFIVGVLMVINGLSDVGVEIFCNKEGTK